MNITKPCTVPNIYVVYVKDIHSSTRAVEESKVIKNRRTVPT